MQILTQALMVSRLGEDELIRLTDKAGVGAVDQVALTSALEDSEAKVLVNVGQRYRLPLGLAEDMTRRAVTSYCVDVAAYELYVRCDKQAPEDLLTKYKDAIAWSRAVGEGRLGLIGETTVEASPASAGTITVVGSDVLIDRESMQGL